MRGELKILLAESDDKAAAYLASEFRQRNWKLLLARDTLFAFSVALKERPDAVILSSELQGGGALVTLQRLRSSIDLKGNS